MLTRSEILMILELLKDETVVEPTKEFPFRVVSPIMSGYSENPPVERLQIKLSAMLQARS